MGRGRLSHRVRHRHPPPQYTSIVGCATRRPILRRRGASAAPPGQDPRVQAWRKVTPNDCEGQSKSTGKGQSKTTEEGPSNRRPRNLGVPNSLSLRSHRSDLMITHIIKSSQLIPYDSYAHILQECTFRGLSLISSNFRIPSRPSLI